MLKRLECYVGRNAHRLGYAVMALAYGAGLAGMTGKEATAAVVCAVYLWFAVRG